MTWYDMNSRLLMLMEAPELLLCCHHWGKWL